MDKTKLPGNIDLPSSKIELQNLISKNNSYKYSVEDFFRKPDKSNFQLSPNGVYLSFMQRAENGKNHLHILNTQTNESRLVLKQKDNVILSQFWLNEQRLGFVKDDGGNENYHLFAIDIDGGNEKDLTPFENTTLRILSLLKEQEEYIIVSLNKETKQIFEPYKLNVITGELEKLFENKDINNPIAGFIFDKDGNLKAYLKQKNGTDFDLFFKTNNSDSFNKVISTSWKDTFSILAFDYKNNNMDRAYVVSNLENNTSEILLYDFKENKIVENIYSDTNFDVSNISLGTKNEISKLTILAIKEKKI